MTGESQIIFSELFRLCDAGKLADSLDKVLFTACMSYLDTESRGIPTKEDAESAMNVRLLLEALRTVERNK